VAGFASEQLFTRHVPFGSGQTRESLRGFLRYVDMQHPRTIFGYPLFTDHTYDNLGVPPNPENPFYYLSAQLNPDGTAWVDRGLGAVVNNPEFDGMFRVPTLRNVAVTPPYMHNGIFKTLREVVVFYSTRDIGPWPEPEVKHGVNTVELGNLGLTQQEIDDLVAFMHTLTDGY